MQLRVAPLLRASPVASLSSKFSLEMPTPMALSTAAITPTTPNTTYLGEMGECFGNSHYSRGSPMGEMGVHDTTRFPRLGRRTAQVSS